MKRNKRTAKRFLSLLLTAAMLLSVTPTDALTVYAETVTSGDAEDVKIQPATEQDAKAEGTQPQETEQNIPAELTIEGETADYTPEADTLPDNDELFAGYAMRTLYGESGIALLSNYGENVLNETELAIYSKLKTAIQAIAAGTSDSTAIAVTTELSLAWETEKSGEELRAEAAEKLKAAINTDKIVDCLLADCPFELYWFDKTVGVRTSYSIQTSTVTSGDASTTTAGIRNLTLSFAVAGAYAGSEDYTTDTAKTGTAAKAAENAQAVIDTNATASDYEKLLAYKTYICDAVSYNQDAASGSYTGGYGDPWQLIYVFDGDDSTNVVCEGYAKAFQYLCDLSSFSGDVTCYTVTGTMNGGTGEGAHMWNIVTIDGANYLVDVTNSDEGSVGAYGGLFLAGAPEGTASGYTITIPSHDLGNGSYTVEATITFAYDGDTTALYGADILTLATEDYTVSEPEPAESPVIDLSALTGSFRLQETGGQKQYSTDGGTSWMPYTGSITLKDGETESANQNVLVQSGSHDVIMSDATLTGNDTNGSAFSISSGASVSLTLIGENRVTGQENYAGIQVPDGASFTITEESTGSLTAQGGNRSAGIGSGSEGTVGAITIDGGTIAATGGEDGAGIGGGYSSEGTTTREGITTGGTITITGGNITATSGEWYSAGIGGGFGGSGCTTTISGGTITAKSDGYGACIGGGAFGAGGTVTIQGGSIKTEGGFNAIGAGSNNSDNGSLTNGSEDVSLIALALNGVDGAVLVTALGGADGYGLKDVSTQDGILYLYLPEKTTANEIKITAGGVDYSLQGENTFILKNPVASVETGGYTTYYRNIANAWKAAKGKADGATVALFSDVSTDGTGLTVEAGDNITLKSRENSSVSGYRLNLGSGELTVTGGEFTLSNVSLQSNNSCIAAQGGSVYIEAGSVSGYNGVHVTGGSVEVWYGTISGSKTYGSGISVVSGKVSISGNASIQDAYYGINVSGNCSLSVSGGNIAAAYTALMIQNSECDVTLSGGTFAVDQYKLNIIDCRNAGRSVGSLLKGGYGYQQNGAWVNNTSATSIDRNGSVVTVTVKKAPIENVTVTADKTSLTYGDAAPKLTAGVELMEGVSAENVTYQWYLNGTAIENATGNTYTPDELNAGEYTYTCTATADGYSLTSDEATVVVEKASIEDATVTLTGTRFEYIGGTEIAVQSVVLNGTELTWGTDYTYSGHTGKDAGTYTVTVEGQGNYTGTATATWEIYKKELVVGSWTIEKAYDGTTDITLDAAEAVLYGVCGQDDVKLDVNGVTPRFADAAVGESKSITYTGSFALTGEAAKNYVLKYQPTLTGTITKRSVSVTPDSLTKEYGTDDPELTYNITSGSLPAGHTLTLSRASGEAIGNYAINRYSIVNQSGEDVSGNYDVTLADVNFQITKPDLAAADVKLTLPDGGYTYDGTAKEPEITVVKNGVTVDASEYTVTYANTNGGEGDHTSAGTVTVTITATEDGNYDGSNSKATFVIEPKKLTDAMLTLTPDSVTYTGEEKALVIAVADDAKTLTPETDYTVLTDSETSKTAAGTYSITVQGAGNYTGTATATWKITPAVLTVTDWTIEKTYDGTAGITLKGTDFILDGVCGQDDVQLDVSNVTAQFDSANAGENKAVSYEGAFALIGDDASNYTLTQPAGLIGTITRRSITVTPDSLTVEYGQPMPTLTYTIGGDGMAEGESLTGALTCSIGDGAVGSYLITQGTLAATENYDLTFTGDIMLEITKPDLAAADVKFTLPDGGYTYDGTAKEPEITVVKNGVTVDADEYTVSYSNTNGGEGDHTSAGTVTVTITATENGNYDGSNSKATFVIEPKKLTDAMLSLSQDAFLYDGSEKIPGITVTDDGKTLTPGTDYMISEESETGKTDVGVYTITAQGMGNYTGNATHTWEIQKTDMTSVTAADVSVTYDRTGHSITVTGAPEGAVITYSTDGENYSDSNPSFSAAGNYTVYYKVQQDNYNDFTGSANVTIAKRPVTVLSITAKDKAYDGATEAALDYSSVTFDGLVAGDTLTVTAVGTFTDKNAGEGKTVSITELVLGGADAGNYVLADGNQQSDTTADITPKDITVEITGGGVYGDVSPAMAEPVGVVDGDSVSVTLTYTGTANNGDEVNSTEPPTQAGSYSVTVGIEEDNYNLVGTVTADFVVARADAAFSVSPDKADKTYGDGAFALVPSHKGNGAVTYTSSNEKVATVENGVVTLQGAGETTITATLAQTANYEGGEISVTVTVEPKDDTLTLEVDKLEYSVTYGDAGFTIGYETESGSRAVFVSSNPDVVTVDENGTVHIVGAGEAVVTLKTEESTNYNAVSGAVTVNVAPKPVTVTAEDKSKTYGEDDPELTYKVSGLVQADALTGIILTRTEGSDVGSYDILVSQEPGKNPNYSIEFVNGTLIIEPKDIAQAAVQLGAVLIANGETQTQEIKDVTVMNSRGETLEVTYTVTGNTGVEPGAYTMTITGTGNFTGTLTGRFVIAPKSDSAVETNPDGDMELGDGTIGVEVSHEENAPETTLVSSKAAIIEMLVAGSGLTAEELTHVADGADINIILKVKDASGTISVQSKSQIEEAADGYTIGQYIDISLFKQITWNGQTGEPVPITNTHDSITISLAVPQALRNTDSTVTRTFRVIRNHEGQVEFLPTTYDAEAAMLTFATDKFSDYAIVYQDTKETTGDDSGTPEQDNNNDNGDSDTPEQGNDNGSSASLHTAAVTAPQTGDDAKPWLWMILLLLSCGGMCTIIFYIRRKRDKAE